MSCFVFLSLALILSLALTLTLNLTLTLTLTHPLVKRGKIDINPLVFLPFPFVDSPPSLFCGSAALGLYPSAGSRQVVAGEMDLFDHLLLRDTHEQAEQKMFPRPSEYAKLGAWIGLLLTGWLLTRGICAAGLPSDCQGKGNWDSLEVFRDVESMFLYGFVLAWFTGVHAPERFWYLFSWHNGHPILFVVSFFLSGVLWSALGEAPGLNNSFSSGSDIGTTGAVVYALGGIGVFVVLVWHIYFAYKNNSGREFVSYVCGRMAVLLFFAVYSGVLLQNYEFHFHHYWIAWALALWAQHNHPFSVLFLAVCTGIFVQGIGAYSFDELFQSENDCRRFNSPVNRFECSAPYPYNYEVRICSEGWSEQGFSCSGSVATP